MTHTRDEAEKTFEAFDEAIEIARAAGVPLEISHIKLATVGVWGQTKRTIDLFDGARKQGLDATADCYPYEAWHSNLEVIVPNKQYDDPASVAEALRVLGGPSRITVTACKAHPEYAGKTLEQIAQNEKISPVALYSRMVREGGADIIGHSMKEEDVLELYKQPWVMVASDGGIDNDHPRGAGTFPRVLGRFVREKHLFTARRGRPQDDVSPGPAHEAPRPRPDRSGHEGRSRALRSEDGDRPFDLRRAAQALGRDQRVYVNGELVWADGAVTGKRPGRVLTGSSADPSKP